MSLANRSHSPIFQESNKRDKKMNLDANKVNFPPSNEQSLLLLNCIESIVYNLQFLDPSSNN